MIKEKEIDLMKQHVNLMRTGSMTERENAKIYLLKHCRINPLCLFCVRFVGNSKVPDDSGYGCLGKKGLCMYYEKLKTEMENKR